MGFEQGGPNEEDLRVRTEVGEPDKRQEYSHRESMEGVHEEASTVDAYKEKIEYEKESLIKQESEVENTKRRIKTLEQQLEVMMKI